jgi:hypothetical protein
MNPSDPIKPIEGNIHKDPKGDLTMQDAAALFSQLELYTGRFPEATLKAAFEQREAITPLLLEELRQMAADPAAAEQQPEDYMRPIYAVYLLAQFRERAAYEPLLAFLSIPGELVMDLMESVVTGDLGRILASICAGDLEPVKALIENPAANEWVRSGTLDTLAALYWEGQLTRDDYIAYLHELFTRRIERTYCVFWGSMVADACELGAVELLPEIQRAFDDGLVDQSFISPSYAEDRIQRSSSNPPDDRRGSSRGFIGSAVDEIRWWACFKEKTPTDSASSPPTVKVSPPAATSASTAAVRTGPKVGRNEPCPCGSGKKYKKCCLV